RPAVPTIATGLPISRSGCRAWDDGCLAHQAGAHRHEAAYIKGVSHTLTEAKISFNRFHPGQLVNDARLAASMRLHLNAACAYRVGRAKAGPSAEKSLPLATERTVAST